MSFDVDQLNEFVLVGSAVTLLAILGVKFSTRVGLPSLLLYLLIGVVLGESGLGIQFDDAALAQALGLAALALILFEGGVTTDWQEARPSMPLGLSLATVGVVVSILTVAIGAHYLLGISWELSFLLGALVSSTDAAAVFSVLRRVPMRRRVGGALEAESGLNDAPTVVLVTLIAGGGIADHSWYVVVGIVVGQIAIGTVCGLAVGFGGAWLMRRAALPASGLYPIAVMALAFFAYGGGTALQGSGFAAVYIAALVLGNQELPHRGATRSFAEGTAWLAQIGLFVMLGLLLSPGRITWTTVGLALAAGVILTFVARPLSVIVGSIGFGMSRSEIAFMSWAGLRGAVPVVLTTIPLAAGLAGAERLFDLVFVMVVVYTLVTGPTLPFMAKVLGVARPQDPRSLDLDVAPLEQIAADLMQVRVTPESRLRGVEIRELRLPEGASVSLVIRADRSLVPVPQEVLKADDTVLVVVPRHLRDRTAKRLHRISRHGRLAKWLSHVED